MAEFNVDLVAVEARFWSGKASYVSATTVNGEIGLLPNHSPLIAQLSDNCVVSIDDTEGNRHTAAVAGGFISVTGHNVTILAEAARWAADVDIDETQQRLERAVEDRRETDVAQARGELRAAARLQA